MASDPQNQNRRIRRWLVALSAPALLVTILVHVLFGVGAIYLVVEHFQKKRPINFQAAGPPAEHNEVEHKVELAKKNNSESAPPDLKRITTTGVSDITMPDVPDAPIPDDPTPAMNGVDGVMGLGTGEGNGYGSGAPSSPFGSFDEPARPNLQGNLIDLKQTQDKKPTGMTPGDYHKKLIQFIAADWDPNILKPYYTAKKPLYTSSIFVPTLHAVDGPKAFGVEKEVDPKMYLVWYKTKAAPTQDGTYHFVGVADDILLVRVDGQTVLDGSLHPVDADLHKREKRYPMLNYRPTNVTQKDGLFVGSALTLKAGDPVDIDIIIGEEPGGWSNYFLFIQREETNYTPQSNGSPLLPPFTLDPNPIHPATGPPSYPPFSHNYEPWQTAKSDF